MRSIRELDNDQFMRRRSNPGLGKQATAEVTHALGVLEPYESMRAHGITLPVMQRAVRKWVLRFRPEELLINLRPGLPCLFGWYAVWNGWPLTVVVAPKQVELAPSDTQHLLLELWHAADRRHVARDVVERDMLIRHIVPELHIEDIMALRVPNIDHGVIGSEHASTSDSPEQPEGSG